MRASAVSSVLSPRDLATARPRDRNLEWLGFAGVLAVACRFVATYDTPVDRALPFVVVLIAICGLVANRWAVAIQGSALLLPFAAIFLTDERTRLLGYGVVVAAAFAIAVFAAPRKLAAHVTLTIAGVLLLRWIPFTEDTLWRELVVLLGAVTVLIAFRERTPMAVAIALAVALVTPIFPGRATVFPFVVSALIAAPLPPIVVGVAFGIAAYFTRYSISVLCVVAAVAMIVGDSRSRLSGQAGSPVLHIPAYAAAIALFALWPWSGLAARAFPRFLLAEGASERQQPVWIALERAQSVSIDAPARAHRVVITASGANASHMRAGRLVGRVEVVGRRGQVIGRDLRIGDIADFGFMRRERFFASRNPPPRVPLDDIHGYGQSAWLHAAGRVAMFSREEIASLHVTAAPDLPPAAKLQIEAVEFE